MKSMLTLIKELSSYPNEQEWLEFKTNKIPPNQLGEYISALSNSAAYYGKKCAYLVFGISDKTHEIVGTDFDPNGDVKNEPLKHYLARQLSPDLNFEFEEVTIDGNHVVVLTVPAARRAPTAFKDERYIRIGSSKEKIRKFPEKEAYLFRVLYSGKPTIENTKSEYQDLSFKQLFAYYAIRNIPLNKRTFKKNLGLLTESGDYNIMAQLLSDTPHTPIRFSIFAGESKASSMISVREFGNQCLLYALDEVIKYGDVINFIQADETNRVVERIDVPLFDNDVFREAVVNAFVHNAWLTLNAPMFSVFSDRIEILSRGALSPEQTMSGFFAGESIPVNQKLSEIFLQLHISERTGRGVPLIADRCGKRAFEFRENAIVVTIPFKWIDKKRPKDAIKVDFSSLTSSQSKVLKEIESRGNITKAELAKAANVSVSTVDRAIAALRESGLLKRVGARKNGHWEVSDA